jgi:hypothetical protein
MKMTQKLRRSTALLFVLVLASTTMLASITPHWATAAPYSTDSIEKRADAWLFGRAMGLCFKVSGLRSGVNRDVIEESEATSGQWFSYAPGPSIPGQAPGVEESINAGTIIGKIVEGDVDDGIVDCHNPTFVKKALEYLGLDAVETLCSMGESMGDFQREHPGSDPGNSCRSGSGDFNFDANAILTDKIQNAWNDVFKEKYLGGKGITESLTDGMKYWISYNTFQMGCRADPIALYDGQSLSGDKKYKTPIYNETTGEIEQWYVETQDGNDTIDVGGNGLFDNDSDSKQHCSTLEGNLDKWVDAYKTEFEALQNDPNNGGGNTNNGGNTDPTCESEGGVLAWFLCGALEFVDSIVSWLDYQINSLLFIDNHIYSTDTLGKAWGIMRNIALLILVPMMMFMVIGTALNFGPFDPYTVKKALPRMFVAVIFIVLSLPICQFAVQLSNVAGQGLGNIIINAAPNPIHHLSDIFSDVSGGTQESLGLVTLVAGVVGFALGGLGVLLSFGAVAIVGLLIGFIILVMRQVLIVTLIVLAPLAILAWIFPGNDKLWGIWKGTFLAMLLMYPIITVLLAAGKFVAGILG